MNHPRLLALSALGAALALGAVLVFWFRSKSPPPPPPADAAAVEAITKSVPHRVGMNTVHEVLQIEASERQIAESLWANEMLAQRHAQSIEKLWDEMNQTTNKLDVLRAFYCGQALTGNWKTKRLLPHGIQLQHVVGEKVQLSQPEWKERLASLARAGWELELIEFRHVRFDPATDAHPGKSRFYVAAHAQNAGSLERASLMGEIEIQWESREQSPGELARVQQVDLTGLELSQRRGEPPFKRVLDDLIQPTGQSRRIDPLILYDLDRDGLSEIILAARNLVYWNRGGFQFVREPLCQFPEEYIATAVIADFDGDGFADFLCHKWEGMFLFAGTPGGHFPEKPRLVWKPSEPLVQPMVLTCGDLDADRDLDLFLAQYKEPYQAGATPKPFYNANDGTPSYLLLNDGAGNFSDGTEAAGLSAKRHRRTYSASFADLDRDADLDLVVVSDFAGLDLYLNDGQGRFTDVTSKWVAEPYAFGMAHALSDFSNDALLDLLMIGMTSPTVRRLDHLQLARAGEDPKMRRLMTHGNRLYLGRPEGGFAQTPLSDSIASSGWSWGCAALDLDNDGWLDVCIANGLESNSSVLDYEPEYWLHDRFIGIDAATDATDLYFKSKFSRTRSRAHSYGGYEINRFYLNLGGTNFFEAGYLLGTALQEDCRSVIADDLDGDGRQDLIVTTFEIWPKEVQRLIALKNTLETTNQWIGFHLREEPGAPSPVGAQFELTANGHRTTRQLVTGDSYRAQHPATAHFGLGANPRVESLFLKSPTANLLLTNQLSPGEYSRIALPSFLVRNRE